MVLDPGIRSRLDAAVAAGSKPAEELTPQEARALLAELVVKQKAIAPADLAVADDNVPQEGRSVPVRIYRPPGEAPFPVMVYFHGGGWVNGNIESHDQFCRLLAAESSVLVVSVEYRRAPEYRFPAAAEDCLAAADWVIAQAAEWHTDVRRVIVAGDSAGGNLAAVVALMRRDRGDGIPLAGQILICPVTGYYDPPTPSYLEYGQGYGLTRAGMTHFWNSYLSEPGQAKYAYAAPLAAGDFTKLPPALVITAEYDVLRDEGEQYAHRLEQAGVPVTYRCVGGVNHGFAAWPDADFELAQAVETRRTIADWIAAIRP